MSNKNLSTDSYKGVRDFYPEDMAIQRYIFDTWTKTAESFGFERYDASILEPSDLYKAKGAANEEMVNDQTYTFTDRGDREVTLRPEMTPTVARMVAGRARALSFPLRWYSIPNLFRYERMQKGRLREHWQLNCDIFGSTDYTADVEMIALAYQTLIDFGAKPEMFEVVINNRQYYTEILLYLANLASKKLSKIQIEEIIRLSDRINKISGIDFENRLIEITGEETAANIIKLIKGEDFREIDVPSKQNLTNVYEGLLQLGFKNIKLNPTLARGFDYYTGTIFEIFEVDSDGKQTGRSLLGGGRYDNLTEMFGGEAVPGIGFGMGDVTMRDFLETHKLLPANLAATSATLVIIPMEVQQNLAAQKIAKTFRDNDISVFVDFGTKKFGKKISDAADEGAKYVIVVGEDEVNSDTYTLKNLTTGESETGSILKLIKAL